MTLRGELLSRISSSRLFVAGGGDADRSLLHRCAGDLVVDHHALVVAVEAEVYALFPVLHGHSQSVLGEGAGAGQCGGDQQGGENLVHDLFLQKRFVLEELYVSEGWRRGELLLQVSVMYSHPDVLDRGLF